MVCNSWGFCKSLAQVAASQSWAINPIVKHYLYDPAIALQLRESGTQVLPPSHTHPRVADTTHHSFTFHTLLTTSLKTHIMGSLLQTRPVVLPEDFAMRTHSSS
jgi:hypothetical protein